MSEETVAEGGAETPPEAAEEASVADVQVKQIRSSNGASAVQRDTPAP